VFFPLLNDSFSFQINLVRRRTPVLLQVYLPSGLFVLVSWISFIVPPEVVPGESKRANFFLPSSKKVNHSLRKPFHQSPQNWGENHFNHLENGFTLEKWSKKMGKTDVDVDFRRDIFPMKAIGSHRNSS